jgi:hypothetical protein
MWETDSMLAIAIAGALVVAAWLCQRIVHRMCWRPRSVGNSSLVVSENCAQAVLAPS